MAFTKATRHQARLRLAIDGPTKAGKTYTALAIGTEISRLLGGRCALIDSEDGRSLLYAGTFDFDHDRLDDFSPAAYAAKIAEAAVAKYPVLIIDGISQAWTGKGGVLEIVDAATSASAHQGRRGSSFTSGWSKGTPEHNKFLEAMLRYPGHLIVTMRSKMEYVLEQKNGREVPRKVGLAPIQRDEVPYEFDILLTMDLDNSGTISGSRADALPAGVRVDKPGAPLAATLLGWLQCGDAPPPETDHVEEEAAALWTAMEQASDLAALDALVSRVKALPEAMRAELRDVYANRKKQLAPLAGAQNRGAHAERALLANQQTLVEPSPDIKPPPDHAAEDALTVEVRDLIKAFGVVKGTPQMVKLMSRWEALPYDERNAMQPYAEDAAKRTGYAYTFPKPPDPTDDLPKGF